jgi:hypothetical protein
MCLCPDSGHGTLTQVPAATMNGFLEANHQSFSVLGRVSRRLVKSRNGCCRPRAGSGKGKSKFHLECTVDSDDGGRHCWCSNATSSSLRRGVVEVNESIGWIHSPPGTGLLSSSWLQHVAAGTSQVSRIPAVNPLSGHLQATADS